MRIRTQTKLAVAGGAAMTMLLAAACGDPGQSGTEPDDPAAAGQGCAPVAGEQLVLLEDDQQLQPAENVLPAVNADASTPELLAALNEVSAVLDTTTLVALNNAVGTERQTSPQAAEEFATSVDLTAQVSGGGSGEVQVGAANFPESQTIAELYSIALSAAGFTPEVQTVGNRELYAQALERGEIHVMPEYLGSITRHLNAEVNGADPEPLATSDPVASLAALRDLGEQVGMEFGEPSDAANQNAFAVTEAFATEYDVRTLTELGGTCSGAETLLGGPPECPQRPFCQLGLEDVYGLTVGPFSTLDEGGPLTKQALRAGQISVGLVFSTDGDLAPAE